MIELLFGALLGVVVAVLMHLDDGTVKAAAVLGAVVVYLASCWRRPFRNCWWPWHASRVADKRGNYKLRQCLLCGGQPVRRWGAWLFGRADD